MHLDANNLCGWTMSQKLPAKSFKWVKKLSEFDERFQKNYLIIIKILHFYLKEKKIQNLKSLFVASKIKKGEL